jgi:hypothetical protein
MASGNIASGNIASGNGPCQRRIKAKAKYTTRVSSGLSKPLDLNGGSGLRPDEFEVAYGDHEIPRSEIPQPKNGSYPDGELFNPQKITPVFLCHSRLQTPCWIFKDLTI